METSEKACKGCGTPFVPHQARQLFCKVMCGVNYHTRERRKRNPHEYRQPLKVFPEKPCMECETIFLPRDGRQKFCQNRCKFRWSSRDWRDRNVERQIFLQKRGNDQTRKETPWRLIIRSAVFRSKERNISCDLTDEWAKRVWTGKCEITHIPFAIGTGTMKDRMRSASLDRIDNSLGYTQDNTRFVLWAVNAIKGTGTDAEMLEVAKAIVENLS